MRLLRLSMIFTYVLFAAACQRLPQEIITKQPAQSTEPQETATLPTVENTEPPASLTSTPPPGPTAAPDRQPTIAPTARAELPESTLFSTAWDNREQFRPGLINEEQAILQQAPGATMYHLDLDITNPQQVRGTLQARYTNQETEALEALYLHLHPQSLGGGMTLNEVLINGQPADFSSMDGKLRIDLPKPLEPGEQLVLSAQFVTDVPGEESTKYKVLAYSDGILALAHFYPMFAVFDENGWHTEPTAAHGDETYADASYYLVRVTAPSDQTVVASGVEIGRQENGDLQQITFAAGPMRDFYLAASSEYEVTQQQVGPVMINSYAPSWAKEGAQVALEAASMAVESFGTRFGRYPYSELDIVTTNTQALGVEYPGIFANALRIYDFTDSASSGIPNAIILESTTAHETAHQWFYGLVGNDQLNEPWLDESLTQYATWLYYVDRYGRENAQGFLNSLQDRYARASDPNLPIGLPAEAYDGRDYSAIVYGRGPLVLVELAAQMGEDTFDAFLRDYSETYRWQTADTNDFFTLAEHYCDCDLTPLFTGTVLAQ